MKKIDPIQNILQSKKYRDLGIPEQTVRDLLQKELQKGRSQKKAIKIVRGKLHNIMAPYLGDPDYEEGIRLLEEAFQGGSQESIRAVCTQLLSSHASTRERIPILENFYEQIFSFIGQPEVILDLACGLNPLSFSWMGLPTTVKYYAFDIHQPRVDLINRFFKLQGMMEGAVCQDILLSPPDLEAQAAFFFKEAHRFEQRQHGCNREFWQALRVRYLLVSLPAESLDGRRNLVDRQRRLVSNTIRDLSWKVTEFQVSKELIFCVDKGYEA